jgi:hypothetical protein
VRSAARGGSSYEWRINMRAVAARRAHGRAAAVVLSALASGLFAASAGAATVAVASTTLTPEQAVPVALSFSGTADAGPSSNLEAVARPAGGIACQADYSSDLSAVGSADAVLFSSEAQSVNPGAYQVGTTFKPPAPGNYQVCAWLSQPSGSSGSSVVGPATTGFTARPPQVSQLTLAVPTSLTPGVTFQLKYTTQTDQQLNLYSLIKKAGALPCADSFELEQQQAQPETTLLGPGDQQVFGGPASTSLTTRQKAGSYLVCSWIEGPSVAQVDAALSTPLTVGTPAPLSPKASKLELRLGKVAATRKHGVSVAGRTASAFHGRLAVAASCGSSSRQTRTEVRNGRFSTHVALPGGCRTRQRVSVKVSWAGSATFAKATANTSVRIGR